MDYHGFVLVVQTLECLAFALNETKRHTDDLAHSVGLVA